MSIETPQNDGCWGRSLVNPETNGQRVGSVAAHTAAICLGIAFMHRVLLNQRRMPTRLAHAIKVLAPTLAVLALSQIRAAQTKIEPKANDDNDNKGSELGEVRKKLKLAQDTNSELAGKIKTLTRDKEKLDVQLGKYKEHNKLLKEASVTLGIRLNELLGDKKIEKTDFNLLVVEADKLNQSIVLEDEYKLIDYIPWPIGNLGAPKA